MSSEPTSPVGIPRATYASLVTERLRDSIIKRELEPGQQLSEVELAKSYGVSRGPVREALQRLIQEGLLISQPHRGVFVPILSDQDVEDIYLVREALAAAGAPRGLVQLLTGGVDVGVYLTVVPAMLLVTMLAAYLPALRATRIAPTLALRHD